jgi:structure-specific endonuclease subunit SLX1
VTAESIRDSIPIIQDYASPDQVSSGDEGASSPKSKKRKTTHGIAGLAVDYTNQKSYVEKAKEIVEFEREGSCAICKSDLEHDDGIYTICPSPGCESVTHMTCLSKHFLAGDEETLVPIKGNCPSGNTELRWVDVVKELSLRMRGQKEVEKLLKVKRVRKTKVSASQAVVESSDGEDNEDEVMEDFAPETQGMVAAEDWHAIDDSDGSDAESVTSNVSLAETSYRASKPGSLGTVIEDSDWDDMEVLD